jgi:hypothetical protein
MAVKISLMADAKDGTMPDGCRSSRPTVSRCMRGPGLLIWPWYYCFTARRAIPSYFRIIIFAGNLLGRGAAYSHSQHPARLCYLRLTTFGAGFTRRRYVCFAQARVHSYVLRAAILADLAPILSRPRGELPFLEVLANIVAATIASIPAALGAVTY